MRHLTPIIITILLLTNGDSLIASDWYVAPDGKATNQGTEQSPWDIASTLDANSKVNPGDSILLLPGTYKRRPEEQFDVRLTGTKDAPIRVRPVPGKRATIDGGLSVQAPSAHLWISGLEILVSEPTPKEPVEPGSHPASFTRPWGGLHLHGGKNCKYINLIIHDCRQGISSWSGEKDCEIYGCIIYDNGWLATDRGHGHCIYTQNQEGTKTIKHCIMTGKYPGTYTMHAYGSERAYVDNYLIEENIAYRIGPFLIGGGRPSRNIQVVGNVLHGVDMRLGYTAPHNEDCVVRDNLIVDGTLSINRFKNVVREDNIILTKGNARPEETEARWFPNQYDPSRAYLAVFNWDQAKTVTIDAAPFLKEGDRFQLLDPKAIFGEVLYHGTPGSGTINIPMTGEFAVFVVVKDERP